jgi:hypothetical protein
VIDGLLFNFPFSRILLVLVIRLGFAVAAFYDFFTDEQFYLMEELGAGSFGTFMAVPGLGDYCEVLIMQNIYIDLIWKNYPEAKDEEK